LRQGELNNLGLKQRRVGSVTVLDADQILRISLKFGLSGVSLERAVDSLLSSGQHQILLNLDGVKTMGAKDLGELISIYSRVRHGGGQFKLLNLTPTVRQLITATSLSEMFAFYESEQQAIESFARDAANDVTACGAPQ
jgi:anti-anti-sigma factor